MWFSRAGRAAPRDFPRVEPDGYIGFRIGPPKLHRRFRIGLPKIQRRFRIGPPQVSLNLPLTNAIMKEKQPTNLFEMECVFYIKL